MKPFLSNEQYMSLPKRYFSDPASEFMSLGEWFVRKYLKKNHDPELFYERNLLDAGFQIGLKYLIKKEENDTI